MTQASTSDPVPKRGVDDLARFGGRPLFAEPLHVGRPHLPDRRRFHERIDEIFDRRWLSNDGPVVRELEGRLAEMAGVRHCVAVANATLGLQLVLQALGVEGDVVMPSFTFVATAHAASWIDLQPRFCDIDPETHNLDPEAVRRELGSNVGAIIGVHAWGRPCAVEALSDLAANAGIPLVFDAAHAIGCSRHGKPIGGFGTAEVFSFHATKVLSSLEGGAIATNDDDLAELVRRRRNFGFTGYDQVSDLGINAKLNEVSAAFGLGSLEAFPEVRERNRRIWERYRASLSAAVPGLDLVTFDPAESSNFQYVVTLVDESRFGLDRDELVSLLHAERILARRYFYPGVHRLAPYRDQSQPALEHTDEVTATVLVLPSGGEIEVPDVERIGDLLAFCHRHAGEIRRRLLDRRPNRSAALSS